MAPRQCKLKYNHDDAERNSWVCWKIVPSTDAVNLDLRDSARTHTLTIHPPGVIYGDLCLNREEILANGTAVLLISFFFLVLSMLKDAVGELLLVAFSIVSAAIPY